MHLLETTTSSWMDIKQIDVVEEVHEEIRQAEVDIAKLKEEIIGLMPVQRMIKSGKRRLNSCKLPSHGRTSWQT